MKFFFIIEHWLHYFVTRNLSYIYIYISFKNEKITICMFLHVDISFLKRKKHDYLPFYTIRCDNYTFFSVIEHWLHYFLTRNYIYFILKTKQKHQYFHVCIYRNGTYTAFFCFFKGNKHEYFIFKTKKSMIFLSFVDI